MYQLCELKSVSEVLVSSEFMDAKFKEKTCFLNQTNMKCINSISVKKMLNLE